MACALKLFSNKYIETNKSVVFVHDFWIRLKYYEEVMFKYFDLIDPITDKGKDQATIAVFTPKVATQELLYQSKIDLKQLISTGTYF